MDWESWEPSIRATLIFIIQGNQILMIEKKRGLGAGKINGPGGKIDPGETALQAIIRETQEEVLVTPHDPQKIGELYFSMSDSPDILCHVFRAESYDGILGETDEAVPVWYDLSSIPFDKMWEDDRYWLPHVIEKRTFQGKFIFDGETMLWHEIQLNKI